MTRDKKGKYTRKYQGLPMWVGYIFLATLTGAVIYAAYLKEQNKPLISPLSDIATPVLAKEPEVVISCEDPKGYLECQAYQKKIDWPTHDKIAKIINCESRWNPDAYHVNTNGTVDLGLVQINSIHKNITNADKLNFKKAINWMIAKVNKEGFGAWRSSYKCHGVK